MNTFEQFGMLTWPDDIPEKLESFTKQQLQDEVNLKRQAFRMPLIDLSGKIKINYNSFFFRPDEINIHSVDFFFDYQPDFDWINIVGIEMDPWRRTCKLKIEYQRFQELGIDSIRSDGTLHRIHVCEGLTFFEDSYKNLVKGGELRLKYLDIIKMCDVLLKNKAIATIETLEKELFVQTDPTGLFYNRTIWSFERIKWYLNFAGFSNLSIDEENSDDKNTAIIAIK